MTDCQCHFDEQRHGYIFTCDEGRALYKNVGVNIIIDLARGHGERSDEDTLVAQQALAAHCKMV